MADCKYYTAYILRTVESYTHGRYGYVIVDIMLYMPLI